MATPSSISFSALFNGVAPIIYTVCLLLAVAAQAVDQHPPASWLACYQYSRSDLDGVKLSDLSYPSQERHVHLSWQLAPPVVASEGSPMASIAFEVSFVAPEPQQPWCLTNCTAASSGPCCPVRALLRACRQPSHCPPWSSDATDQGGAKLATTATPIFNDLNGLPNSKHRFDNFELQHGSWHIVAQVEFPDGVTCTLGTNRYIEQSLSPSPPSNPCRAPSDKVGNQNGKSNVEGDGAGETETVDKATFVLALAILIPVAGCLLLCLIGLLVWRCCHQIATEAQVSEVASAIAVLDFDVLGPFLSLKNPSPAQKSLQRIVFIMQEFTKYIPNHLLETIIGTDNDSEEAEAEDGKHTPGGSPQDVTNLRRQAFDGSMSFFEELEIDTLSRGSSEVEVEEINEVGRTVSEQIITPSTIRPHADSVTTINFGASSIDAVALENGTTSIVAATPTSTSQFTARDVRSNSNTTGIQSLSTPSTTTPNGSRRGTAHSKPHSTDRRPAPLAITANHLDTGIPLSSSVTTNYSNPLSVTSRTSSQKRTGTARSSPKTLSLTYRNLFAHTGRLKRMASGSALNSPAQRGPASALWSDDPRERRRGSFLQSSASSRGRFGVGQGLGWTPRKCVSMVITFVPVLPLGSPAITNAQKEAVHFEVLSTVAPIIKSHHGVVEGTVGLYMMHADWGVRHHAGAAKDLHRACEAAIEIRNAEAGIRKRLGGELGIKLKVVLVGGPCEFSSVETPTNVWFVKSSNTMIVAQSISVLQEWTDHLPNVKILVTKPVYDHAQYWYDFSPRLVTETRDILPLTASGPFHAVGPVAHNTTTPAAIDNNNTSQHIHWASPQQKSKKKYLYHQLFELIRPIKDEPTTTGDDEWMYRFVEKGGINEIMKAAFQAAIHHNYPEAAIQCKKMMEKKEEQDQNMTRKHSTCEDVATQVALDNNVPAIQWLASWAAEKEKQANASISIQPVLLDGKL